MIFYNVRFSFKAGSDETAEMRKVRSFLDDLKSRSKLHGYRLMKNRAPHALADGCDYQLMAEFSDAGQFSLPFAEVEDIGVHAGRHGAMIENVDYFAVEVFDEA
jgi:hypothetical protein